MKKTIALLFIFLAIFGLTACDDSSDHEGEAKSPSGSRIQRGRQYEDVIKIFEEKGFINIKAQKIEDLLVGWMTKDGEVESVMVDGDENYSPDVWYPIDVEVVVAYHTFPENTSSEIGETSSPQLPEISDVAVKNEQTLETSLPKDVERAEEIILTTENNIDLSTILSNTRDVDPAYGEFVNQYRGRLIELDSCIVYVTNHGNAKTRYDLLLYAGDYVDEDTANPGPTFKFEDVNPSNMGIKDLYLPRFISEGSNVYIVAEVFKYNDETGVITLKPISVVER